MADCMIRKLFWTTLDNAGPHWTTLDHTGPHWGDWTTLGRLDHTQSGSHRVYYNRRHRSILQTNQ